MKLFLGIFILLFTLSSTAYAGNAVILLQKNTPIEITLYKARYSKGGTFNGMTFTEEISHSVKLKNISDQKIVAFKIGLLAYDSFNKFLGKFNGFAVLDLPVGKEKRASWGHRPYAMSAFEKYGTGLAYVSIVRYEDGSFWRVDLNDILGQLQNFKDKINIEDLIEKRE